MTPEQSERLRRAMEKIKARRRSLARWFGEGAALSVKRDAPMPLLWLLSKLRIIGVSHPYASRLTPPIIDLDENPADDAPRDEPEDEDCGFPEMIGTLRVVRKPQEFTRWMCQETDVIGKTIDDVLATSLGDLSMIGERERRVTLEEHMMAFPTASTIAELEILEHLNSTATPWWTTESDVERRLREIVEEYKRRTTVSPQEAEAFWQRLVAAHPEVDKTVLVPRATPNFFEMDEDDTAIDANDDAIADLHEQIAKTVQEWALDHGCLRDDGTETVAVLSWRPTGVIRTFVHDDVAQVWREKTA